MLRRTPMQMQMQMHMQKDIEERKMLKKEMKVSIVKKNPPPGCR